MSTPPNVDKVGFYNQMKGMLELIPSEHRLPGFFFVILQSILVTLAFKTEDPEFLKICVWGIFGLGALFIPVFFITSRSKVSKPASSPSQGQIAQGFKMLDEEAQLSFLKGGSAETLEGHWKVYWFAGDKGERFKREPDLADSDVTPETCRLYVRESQIFGACEDPFTAAKFYWFFGRISEANHITLTYWSDRKLPEKILVGTVFLEIEHKIQKENKGPRLTGVWHGCTDPNTIKSGTVIWEKM
jgi:hypothetical protein